MNSGQKGGPQQHPHMATKDMAKGQEWPKCRFWVDRKKRYCRMDKLSETVPYCGEHMPNGVGTKWERVPCPWDEKHTCYKHLYDKHVGKCNRRPPNVIPDYVEINVNIRLTEQVQVEERKLQGLKDQEFSSLLKRILDAHQDHVRKVQVPFGIHSSVAGEMFRSDVGDNAVKNLSQIGSIVHLLDKADLLREDTVFIEYGGGRGGITFHLAKAVVEKKLNNCKFIVIDRTSPRHKKDNRLHEFGVEVVRIRCDIKDLRVGELPFVTLDSVKHVVGVAKHVCGSATDMSLFSLLNGSSNTHRDKVIGFCFATCCHHKCNFETYLGFGDLQKWFSRAEFDLLTRMSSWATCGDEVGRIDDVWNIDTNLFTRIEQRPDTFRKVCIGNLVKDIMDCGRAQYVRNVSPRLKASLVMFTDSETSLENRALVCTTEDL